jgi:hypothetical protein
MIRELPSGQYRLYSRKKNPQTGKRRSSPGSPKAHQDRRRRGEHLGGQAEPPAALQQRLFQPVRRRTVAVQRPPQAEHERDRVGLPGRLDRRHRHGATIPRPEKHERPGGNPGARFQIDQLTRAGSPGRKK